MSTYHRRPKVEGTYEAVKNLQRRLEEAQTEREKKEGEVTQANSVAERWRATFYRRTNELAQIDSQIADLTKALDALAPEVDEYGIERRQRERSEA